MKLSAVASPWELLLGAACIATATVQLVVPEAPQLLLVAGAGLAVCALVWYRQRMLGGGADEYAKLQMAALSVQILWLSVLYDIAAGLLFLPEPLLGPLSALLMAIGAAALAAAVLVALDLALVGKSSLAWGLALFYALVVGATQAGAASPASALLPLALAGVLLGLLAPMGWLITIERRQRLAVLLGGLLATVPLATAAVIFIRRPSAAPGPPTDPLTLFVAGASLFCLTFVVLLLVRVAQALSGARLYEKKVRELDAVYDFGLTTTSALDPQEFQTAVLRSLSRIGGPDVVALVEPGNNGQVSFSLLRRDAAGEHIYRHRSRGSWPDLSIGFSDRRPLSVADHARGQPSVLPRIWEPATGSSVIVPVLAPGGAPRALLIAGKHEPFGFNKAEIRSLSGFANQVGLAMEHARLLLELVEGERRRSELEFARQMQLDLLPKTPPVVAGLDIADRSTPATEVGGDYFDYLWLPNGHLGVVFGDVAGHGMTAGLIMAMAKSAVHTQVRAGGRPAQLLPRLGEVLLELSAPNQYMTMVFAELDLEARCLRYLNAGHHFPLHYRCGTREVEYLESTGPPLGLLPSHPGEPRDRELLPGDVLAFYSDGLVEAFNANDQDFGIQRLGRIIARRAEQPAATIVEEVFAAVRRFTGDHPWHDDATLVVVRMLADSHKDAAGGVATAAGETR
jgi:serine phosphatase RsbU (regulator of sigma subunit)